jgi:hypothetical protein
MMPTRVHSSRALAANSKASFPLMLIVDGHECSDHEDTEEQTQACTLRYQPAVHEEPVKEENNRGKYTGKNDTSVVHLFFS